LARADVEPETMVALRQAFPRAARYLTDEPDAPPMPALLGLLARHPSLAAGWLTFSGGLLDHGVLDARVRELLLLAVVQRTKTSYVFKEHVAIAKSVGITDAGLRRLEQGSRSGWSELDSTLLRAVDELLEEQTLGDATWQELTDQFGEQSLLELLFVVGTYTCLGMVLNSVGLVPEGQS
jgi:alkylhydroperoxidase family enzyme